MDLLLFIPVLLISIVAHEVAHAWQARREGDRTAEDLGRITLNPLAHLDLMGSFLVPALLYAGGGILFGWARPVPVDPSRFRSHPLSDIRVSLAGIVANLLLVLVFGLIGALLLGALRPFPAAQSAVWTVATTGMFLNLVLALFNLLPIPPLDGSHVVAQFLPARWAGPYQRLGAVGLLVLMAAAWVVPGLMRAALGPAEWVMGIGVAWLRLWQ
jgi:Zn-dependent protease